LRRQASTDLDHARDYHLRYGHARIEVRIAAALEIPDLSGQQKLDFGVTARRVTTAFNTIGETLAARRAMRLYMTSRSKPQTVFRDPIAAANLALDGFSSDKGRPSLATAPTRQVVATKLTAKLFA
jgi:hypothetical protein